ncbi:MAG: Ig-like domain-containing protein [Dysgonamonadaceae bacterium]|jgi:uncharacterized protein YjdB|nr:Ig-like domain-containing protein [Dysgonamonadaceae bacterium]
MKSFKYHMAGLIAACCIGLYSCENEKDLEKPIEAITLSSINIEETDYHADATTVYLLKGQELQLNYTLTPAENVTFPEVIWTSSDESVAQVSQTGKITAQNKEGQSIIMITPVIGFGPAAATPAITIIVLDHYVYMKEIRITNPLPDDEMIDVGQTYRLSADFTTESGDPATFIRYHWTSSDPTVATVDKEGVVRGVAQGNVTITCTPDDQNPQSASGITATTVIRIRQIIPIETFEIIADPELNALGYGQEYQIRFNVTPIDATISSIVWESDNAGAISVDNEGKLTVNSMDAAMAAITATAGDIVKTVNVAVAQGRLWYSFADKFTPWTVTTADAAVQSSDGTKTTIQMSNPTNEGSAKHRGDVNLVTNNSGVILTVHPNTYRYLAVKIQFPTVLVSGSNSNGCIKLEMFDNPRTIGPVYTGNTASNQNNVYTLFGAGEISTTEPNILYFDMLETKWSGEFTTGTSSYNLVQFKFVIADYPVAAPWTYDIYWVRTFKTLEELTAYISAEN